MDGPLWLTKKEVCSRLDMSERQFREYVQKKIFPAGVKRGKNAMVWTQEDVDWMFYREKNAARFDEDDPDIGEPD